MHWATNQDKIKLYIDKKVVKYLLRASLISVIYVNSIPSCKSVARSIITGQLGACKCECICSLLTEAHKSIVWLYSIWIHPFTPASTVGLSTLTAAAAAADRFCIMMRFSPAVCAFAECEKIGRLFCRRLHARPRDIDGRVIFSDIFKPFLFKANNVFKTNTKNVENYASRRQTK